jgi:streptogramin lyase
MLWLGTNGGGLNKLNPKTGAVTFYTEENGLQSNKIIGLTGDKNGNLWISSPKGITFFNTHTLKTNWFDVSDGLGGTPAGQLVIGTFAEYATYKDDDGTVYFGSDNGLTVFHPDHVYLNGSRPPVAQSHTGAAHTIREKWLLLGNLRPALPMKSRTR